MVKRLSIGPTRYAMVIGMVAMAATAGLAVNFAWRGFVEPIEPWTGGRVDRPATAVNDRHPPTADKVRFEAENLVARPLFSPERRPTAIVVKPPAVAPVASPIMEAMPVYAISGIVVSSGSSKVLLRSRQREAGRWLALGETTDEGWTVTIIDPNTVTLARAERRLTLMLYERERAQPTAALRQ